jgi:hypothetical protein
MEKDDTSTPSYRVERGEPENDVDPTEEQSKLSLGSMIRGPVGTEGEQADSASPGAESDRRDAESSEGR